MTRRGPASSNRAAIRRKLLRWYDLHQRALPWRRRADDPYAQWVAEIMLQQTRVETVMAYYERFLRRFPTIGSLARADHEEVLKHWEGLGYYRRILHLHRAARMVCDDGGVIPDNSETLRALPGVGEYTAAAIASIAFNRPEAAVDGNVARVLSRLFGVTEDVRTPVGKSRIRDLARSLLPRQRPGDFNQAWMDLGSLVCTPKAPRCDVCPLRAHCLAAEKAMRSSIPSARPPETGNPKQFPSSWRSSCMKGRCSFNDARGAVCGPDCGSFRRWNCTRGGIVRSLPLPALIGAPLPRMQWNYVSFDAWPQRWKF